jgi:hypothetical protein
VPARTIAMPKAKVAAGARELIPYQE